MIEIYPKLSSSFSKCPACGCQLSSPTSLTFSGRYILSNTQCSCCDVWFYHSYPAKDKNDPTCFAFSKDGKHVTYNSKVNKWNVRFLMKELKISQKRNVILKIEIRESLENITLVNLLGQTQKSIMNLIEKIQLNLKDTSNLIFIVSDPAKHLIPESISEVWSLKKIIKSNNKSMREFNESVQKQFPRFKKVSIYNLEGNSPIKDHTSLFEKISIYFRF